MLSKAITRVPIAVVAITIGSLSGLSARAGTPCDLLTPAQVATVLGGSVATGKSLATTVCQWAQQGKPGDELLKLDVDLVTVDRFARMKTVTAGTVTGVSGLGDDAYYSTLQTGRTTLTTLNVKKGNAAVTIRVSGGMKPVEEYQQKEKLAAQALLPKL